MATVANILRRVEELDWSPYWHGPHPERPATDIPSQLRALLAGVTPAALSKLTADFTLGGEAGLLLERCVQPECTGGLGGVAGLRVAHGCATKDAPTNQVPVVLN